MAFKEGGSNMAHQNHLKWCKIFNLKSVDKLGLIKKGSKNGAQKRKQDGGSKIVYKIVILMNVLKTEGKRASTKGGGKKKKVSV